MPIVYNIGMVKFIPKRFTIIRVVVYYISTQNTRKGKQYRVYRKRNQKLRNARKLQKVSRDGRVEIPGNVYSFEGRDKAIVIFSPFFPTSVVRHVYKVACYG